MNSKLLRLHWVDQITGEPKKTADFYSALLGFGQESVDEGNGDTSYCLTDDEGNEVFGVVEEANFKNWAPGWVIYFEVDDFDAQCEKVEALGGQIISKSERHCLISDPSGAPIVISPIK